MRSGTTTSGFNFEYDEIRANDMRFVDLIAIFDDAEAGEFSKLAAASKIIELLLGKEQKQALYKHIGEAHEGRVPFEDLGKALTEIMQAGGSAVKN